MNHPENLDFSASGRLPGLEVGSSSSGSSRLRSASDTTNTSTKGIQINEEQQQQRSELIGYQHPPHSAVPRTSKHSKTISMNTSYLLHSQQVQVHESSNSNEIQHNPRAELCFCSACHLSFKLFPRTEDGRIVLPTPPWVSVSHHQLQEQQQGFSMVDGHGEQGPHVNSHTHDQRIYHRNHSVPIDMNSRAMSPPDFFHNSNDQLRGTPDTPALIGPGISGNTVTGRTIPTPVSSQVSLPHRRHHPHSQISDTNVLAHTTSYLGPSPPPHPQSKSNYSISISERTMNMNAPNLYKPSGTSSSPGIGSADGSPILVPGSSCQEGSTTISAVSKRLPSVKGRMGTRKKSKGKGVDEDREGNANMDVDDVEMVINSSAISTVEGPGGKDPSLSVIRKGETPPSPAAQAGVLISPCKPRRGRPPRHETVPGTSEFTVFL